MRSIFIFIFVFLLAILLGSILAWPIFELTSTVVDTTFRRVISHTTLIFGLIISLLYLKRYAGLSFAMLGYKTPRKSREFFNGFIIGIALLTVIEITLLSLGTHTIDSRYTITIESIAILLLKGLLVGLVVSIVEETIFRGALYGGLRQQSPLIPTIIIISLVYAAVHYLKYPDISPDTVVTWSTGLESLPRALNRFSRPVYYDAMFTLVMLGILFGMMRHLSANLISCIGLHTAIVMGDKTITKITNYVPDGQFAWLANKYQTTLGHASSFWLIVFCIVYYFYMKRSQQHV